MLPSEMLDPDDPRPWLLLDIDGVINIWNQSQNVRLYERHRVLVGETSYPIKIRRDMKDWLFELTEDFIPVWCTMWNDEANEYMAPLLELPHLAVIPCSYQDAPESIYHVKVHSIRTHVPKGRAIAWVDDEIGSSDFSWASRRDRLHGPTKLIKTDERVGLLRHHVEKLSGWAKEVKQGAL